MSLRSLPQPIKRKIVASVKVNGRDWNSPKVFVHVGRGMQCRVDKASHCRVCALPGTTAVRLDLSLLRALKLMPQGPLVDPIGGMWLIAKTLE